MLTQTTDSNDIAAKQTFINFVALENNILITIKKYYLDLYQIFT